MLYTIPDYYHQFHCIAGACEDTCCAGWQIVADEKSIKKYRVVKGPFQKQLRNGIDWKQHCFKQDQDHRCAFLNNENLCEMYKNLGEKSLCRTCRLYPRHIEEFEDTREITLSVSCPSVADILMHHMEPVTFRTVEKEGEEEYEDFDPFLYSQLLDARDVLYQLLQNRTEPVKIRMGLAYGLGRDMQRRINHENLFETGAVLEKYQKESAKIYVQNRIQEKEETYETIFSFMKEMFHKLFQLELLKKDWGLFLLETEKRIFIEKNAEEYKVLTEEFLQWMDQHDMKWEIRKEQILVYFTSTYFCGAVYDGQVLPKVQFALLSADILEELLKSRWLRNEKDLTEEELIEIVYRYSREVEHSDFNLKKMEEMMPLDNGRF